MSKARILWTLAVFNVLLLVVLLARIVPDSKVFAAAAGRPSDYIMIPAGIPGNANGVVYVIDTANAKLSAISFDDANGRMSTMPPIDLQRVFDDRGGVAPGRGGAVPPRGGVVPPR